MSNKETMTVGKLIQKLGGLVRAGYKDVPVFPDYYDRDPVGILPVYAVVHRPGSPLDPQAIVTGVRIVNVDGTESPDTPFV